MGGGLRQGGFLAAAGLVALKEMIPNLEEDHKKALLLGEELAKIPGIKVNLDDIHINMVFFDMSKTNYDTYKLVDEFYKRGIKINPVEDGLMRFVTNFWVSYEGIHYVVNSMKDILN